MITTAPRHAGPARRLAVAGAAAELAAVQLTEHRAGRARDAYTHGRAGGLGKAAKLATASGAAVVARAGRSRPAAVAGGALLTAGAICERWSVFLAGKQSAADPSHTVEPQRERLHRARTATPGR